MMVQVVCRLWRNRHHRSQPSTTRNYPLTPRVYKYRQRQGFLVYVVGVLFRYIYLMSITPRVSNLTYRLNRTNTFAQRH